MSKLRRMIKANFNWRLIFLYLLFLVISLIIFHLSWSRAFSFHFVDEEDHMVFASYMNQGLDIYKDLSSNHQPLVYLGSSWLQTISRPRNILQLIRVHRLAVFLYAFLWNLLLVIRFRELGIVLVILFEVLKFQLFGNLFLMETLAVYPTIYLAAVTLEMTLMDKLIGRKESIFLGLCFFLAAFNLLTLWPWLGLIWLMFLFKNKASFLWQVTTFMLTTAVLFMLVSPWDWFRETIWNNLVYAIPIISPIKSVNDWWRLVFFPFLAFGDYRSLQSAWIKLFFGGWLTVFLYAIWKKDNKVVWLASGYVFLLLANNRVLRPEAVFYQGFHLLPWLGLLIVIFLFSLKWLSMKNKKLFRSLLAILSLLGLSLLLNKNMIYFIKTDPETEFSVNYSDFADLNWALRSLSRDNDRLAVFSNEPLIYWQTGTKPASRQIVYYPWEETVPDLKQNYELIFKQKPPEFIYGNGDLKLIKEVVAEKYIEVSKQQRPTRLFIRKDKLENIDQSQWLQASQRGFGTNKIQEIDSNLLQ